MVKAKLKSMIGVINADVKGGIFAFEPKVFIKFEQK